MDTKNETIQKPAQQQIFTWKFIVKSVARGVALWIVGAAFSTLQQTYLWSPFDTSRECFDPKKLTIQGLISLPVLYTALRLKSKQPLLSWDLLPLAIGSLVGVVLFYIYGRHMGFICH